MKKQYLLICVLFALFFTEIFAQTEANKQKESISPKPELEKDQTERIVEEPAKAKKISFKVSGNVRVLGTIDWGNVQNTSEFITTSIPIYPEPKEKHLRTSFDPRQSRIGLETNYLLKEDRKMKVYVELDFYSSEAITDFRPRLRHAYAEFEHFIVGQTWSTAFNADATPNQVDFEGPNSILGPRNPQVRFTYAGQRYSFAAALETHLEDYTPYISGYPYSDIDDLMDFQSVPDLIVYIQKQGDWGNMRLTGILRSINYTNHKNNEVENIVGKGVSFSSYVNFLERDGINEAFYCGITYGKGIAYYINDIRGLGYDGFYTNKGQMETPTVMSWYLAYKHAWNKRMQTNIIGGYVDLDNEIIEDNKVLDNTIYCAINLMYQVYDKIEFGAEYLYGKNTNKKGDWGEGSRIQLMSTFKF
jgi:hypothetical protein